ncbi:DUF4893 domain-containing protein [Mesorhizobium sp. NBSH29]|uniref:DUF4893 domain-containing protein n=1 Tax=Mesorhizobium sp. NBSH29 TaxID=2654249 RepID=UPI0018966B0E|nr:DUF4893 domain-containing protein [Mesorhizobium sp. NBSH29]QPC88088.1 DUF4893 domain-containing protein [Mesorhizobium sp. NBSH29]
MRFGPALIATTLLLGIALPAHATGTILSLITKEDQARIGKFNETRSAALSEAKAGASKADLATLAAVTEAKPLAFQEFNLSGNWRCRTIKVGGISPLVIYGWFKCRVSDDGSGWLLEKTTGSQRTKGRFFTESDTRSTYLGSFFVAGDTPKPYGSGVDSDQVGYAMRTGKSTWKIEFPAPRYESKLDILEFRR